MRIVFMGTPDFAVPSLQEIVKAGHQIVQVITQPDRPRGRGQLLTSPPVKAAAEELGLQVFQPEKVKTPQVVNFLRQLDSDVIVVVAFGQLLSREILETPRHGCVNVHASVLPKYRGAAPIHWAVINGEKESGVSIMYMDEGLDTGDVILEKKVAIKDTDTTGDLHDKLAELGAKALIEALGLIAEGKAKRFPQEDSQATYAPLLNRQVELINWGGSSKDIVNLIRGLNPWPGAYTYLNNQVLKIWVAEEVSALSEVRQYNPGQVIEALPGKGIIVATGNGAVKMTEIQLQGNKRMHVEDFLRGRSLAEGTVLGRMAVKS